MGVTLVRTAARPIITVSSADIDETLIRSIVDSNMSDYLKIITEDAAGIVRYQAKAGDHRFEDVDDTDQSDTLQITCDDADGSMKQKTSQITDGNIWDIVATGTISGATATVDINYLNLDLDALVLNDGAANALTITGHRIDFNGATLTAVSLSTLYGMYLDLPDLSSFAAAAGLLININASTIPRFHALKTNHSIECTHPEWTEFSYFEDFMDVAAALAAARCAYYWAETNDGVNGTVDIPATTPDAPGVIQLDTTVNANSWAAMTWSNVGFEADFIHELIVRFKTSAITNTLLEIGWRVDGNDYVTFQFDTADHASNIYLAGNNNAVGEQLDDSGCDLVANQWYVARIKITNTTITASLYDETAATWYDVTVSNVTIRNLNTFVPYIYVNNKAAAEQKILSIDYVKIFAARA